MIRKETDKPGEIWLCTQKDCTPVALWHTPLGCCQRGESCPIMHASKYDHRSERRQFQYLLFKTTKSVMGRV